MALFEDFVEPFTDLDQWSLSSGTGSDPTVAGGAVVFPVLEEEDYDRIISTVDAYDLTNSWVSFRVKAVGSYAQGVIGQAGTEESPLLILNDYPGFPGLSLNMGPTLVTLPADSQPHIIIYADDTTATIAYSTDLGDTWDTFNTYDLTELTNAGSSHLQLGTFPFNSASEDYNIEFDQINQYNLDGPVGEPEPETTEVDVTINSTWRVGRPYLRHSTRHLHRTLFDYLQTQLGLAGWTGDQNINFGCDPVVLQDVLPEEWDEESVLTPGTVALTVGDEFEALNQEMGGPLALIEVPFFVDVFGDTPGTTLALALDIRDIFCGRLPESTRYHNVTNYNTSPATVAQGYTVEVEDVVRTNVKKNWEVVKLTANMYFQDVEGN